MGSSDESRFKDPRNISSKSVPINYTYNITSSSKTNKTNNVPGQEWKKKKSKPGLGALMSVWIGDSLWITKDVCIGNGCDAHHGFELGLVNM